MHYDIIVIGSGAGGGTLAHALAPTGKRILLLERGDYVPREKDNWSTRAVNVDARYNTKETWRDRSGAPLEGSARYRLHVPADPPARQFWALTLYDCETAAFIERMQKVEVNSYQALAHNPDGSVDLAIGGSTPAIGGANHLPTAAGRRWFAMFRFYGPTRALFDRSWQLPDFERLDFAICVDGDRPFDARIQDVIDLQLLCQNVNYFDQ